MIIPSYNQQFQTLIKESPLAWETLLKNVEHRLRFSPYFGCEADDGNREPYPFASPLFLDAGEVTGLTNAVRAIQLRLQDVGDRIRRGEELLPGLSLFTKSLTRQRFLFDHGYRSFVPIPRLDLTPTPKGAKVLEINAGCPGGELDGGLLGRVFSDEGLLRSLNERLRASSRNFRFSFVDPRKESLEKLLEVYEDFRTLRRPDLPKQPNIAVVTSEPQRKVLGPEALGIAEFYRVQGCAAWAGDLSDLAMHDGNLFLGNREVHLVYRKFSSISYFKRLNDQANHPHLRQVNEGLKSYRFCLVNPLSSTLLQDKALLAVLHRDYEDLRPIIPETHVLEPGLFDRRPDLREPVFSGEAFIAKRRISFAGKWVILEPAEISKKIPELITREPGAWIVQKRVEPARDHFVLVHDNRIKQGEMAYNTACFGDSFFVRVSLGGAFDPINAGSGGAETCLFGVEAKDI